MHIHVTFAIDEVMVVRGSYESRRGTGGNRSRCSSSDVARPRRSTGYRGADQVDHEIHLICPTMSSSRCTFANSSTIHHWQSSPVECRAVPRRAGAPRPRRAAGARRGSPSRAAHVQPDRRGIVTSTPVGLGQTRYERDSLLGPSPSRHTPHHTTARRSHSQRGSWLRSLPPGTALRRAVGVHMAHSTHDKHNKSTDSITPRDAGTLSVTLSSRVRSHLDAARWIRNRPPLDNRRRYATRRCGHSTRNRYRRARARW